MSDCCRVGLPSYLHGILINWSKPLGHFMHFVASPNIAKKDYLSAIDDKLERLWIDLTTTVQNRYSSGFDSAFLHVMAPALEAAFTYKKRSLRNYTLIFWTATFGNQDSLQYPEVLKPCLAKMKTIGEIPLPGWTETEGVCGETPVIPETEDPDDVIAPPAPPTIPNFGAPSPQKMHGSFLHRLDDAKKLLAASSPVKGQMTSPGRGRRIQTYSPGSAKRKQFASPMAMDAAKRRLHVDEDKNTAFVVISSEPKKKRVLTEHQKEVMRTKRVSLALYNGLDQSQDTQAFTQTQSQSQVSSPVPTPEVEDLPDDAKKFNFSEITGQKSTAGEEFQKEKKAEEEMKEIEEEDSVVVLPSSQEKTQKPARRIVTFFEPVKKSSSPIKDSGQMLMEDGIDHHGNNTKDVDADGSNGETWSDAVQELQSDCEKESSVLIVDDTCPDVSQGELGLLSGADVDKDAEGMEEEGGEFVVPETQEESVKEPGDSYVSNTVMPVVVGESPVKDKVIPESYVESPSKDDNPSLAQEESPSRDVLDAEDLMDVLPDGRFQKVISTPVIKLQKLSQREIELYSPRAARYSQEDTQEQSPFKKPQDYELAGGSDASSPKMQSPGQSSPAGTPRLRRYRSDEIHNRKGTPKSARRSNSVSEVSSPKSKVSHTKKATDLNILQASQQDLADLAERYELDGIAPLGDDLDQSIEECLANLDKQDGETDDDLPSVDYGQTQKSDEVMPDSERMEDHSVDREVPDEDVLCSQQELFSSTMDETGMDETVIEVMPHSVEEVPERDVVETEKSAEVSSQKSTRRRSGRSRKSQSSKEEVARSQEENEEETSQDSTCADSDNVEQVTTRRGRSKLSQNSENERNESQEKSSIAEVKNTARRRGKPRKTEDVGEESQASESGEKETEEIKRKRSRPQKTCDRDEDSQLEEAEEGKKSEKTRGRPGKEDEKISSLDKNDQETDSEVLGTPTKRGRSRKFEGNEGGSQKQDLGSQEELTTIGRKRRRQRKSDVFKDQKASSQEDQLEVSEGKNEDASERLAADADLSHEKQQDEKMVQKECENKVLPEVEMTAPNSVTEPEANSSSEDLFGTQSETLPKTGDDTTDPQLNDCVSSDDDDVPLVQIKASLQSKADKEFKPSETNDAGNSSEDSEVDFPIMTPSNREDKVSPTTETPPRDQLADVLTRLKEKDTPKHDLSALKEEEVLTVTRSGRKCRPSIKIRCAKDILRKALMSPDGRHKLSKAKAAGALKSPTRISPKALRSMAQKLAMKETSPIIGKKKHKHRSHSPEKKDALGAEEAGLKAGTNLPNEDVSTYAISPKSLKALAEKVAQDLSPERILSPPKVRSARRSRPLSPKTSSLSSSQILRNARSGKSSKRSKSPVSKRLRSKRLLLSPGPIQTREGTKLSRMEIKKRNKTQKATKGHLEQPQEEKNSIDNIVGGEQPKEGADHEADEKVSKQAEEVIVIKDTMSQEMDEDSTQVEEERFEGGLVKGTDQTSETEIKDNEKDGNECITNVDASLDAVDEDGDIEMKDLEQMMSQDHEVPKVDEVILQQPQPQEAEDVAEFENKIGEQSKDTEIPAAQDITSSEEHLSEPVPVEQDLKKDFPEKDDDGIKQNDAGWMKTRSKRSSQRLTFGEEGDSVERSSEKESSALREVDKLEDVQVKEDESDKSESDGDEDSDDDETSIESEESGEEEEEEKEQVMEAEGMDGLPKSTDTFVKDGDLEEVKGTPIGVVSSGLDVQDTLDDIINSSQSPLKFLPEEDSVQPEGTTDSSSQRLTFPNLSPPEMDNQASPERLSMACMTLGPPPFRVSPIIPTKFTPRTQGSPEGASMRPRWPNQVDSPEGSIPHMYSPTASPSSGILKRRDMIGSSSPSPSSKSRRVSFADKVFIEPEPLQDHSADPKIPKTADSSLLHGLAQDSSRGRLPMSPLVTTASSKVHNSKYITTPSKSDSSQSSSSSPSSSSSSSSSTLHRLRRKSPHSSRRMKSKPVKSFPKSSSYASKVFNMVNQNQESMKKPKVSSQSTQGSLTQGSPSTQVDSSLEAQGESQGSVYPALAECSLPVENVLPRLTSSMWLVRARNIRTIGDLSSLSPMQVQSLPIKSPKVGHLKNVLSAFQTEKFPESKGTEVDSLSKAGSSTKDDGSSTPPGRPPGQRSNTEATEEMTSKDPSGSLSPPRSPQPVPGSGLLGRLEGLVSDFKDGALDSLPAAELFRAHQHVNNLTEIIMGALKAKCHSPSMTKDN
eukprot:XP_011683000.1 PREDICTED: telomere-associated protein RIF1 [Strongylocentrotus purpuratus]